MKAFGKQQLLDCVSANELLEALSTLNHIEKQIPDELELSFSQSSHSYFNTVQQNNHMDFQLYMAIKNNPTNPNNHKKKDINHPNKCQTRKSVTPKNIHKQTTPIKTNKSPKLELNNFKSRSHSPVLRTTISPINKKNNPKLTSNKQNQPNLKEVYDKPKINENSKKIIMEKQKSGKAYIPIHQRMGEILREKQEKIAKIQKKTVTNKEIEERQCTFKPTINDWKKIQSRLNSTSLNDISMTTIRKTKNNENSLTNKNMGQQNSRVTILDESFQTYNKTIDELPEIKQTQVGKTGHKKSKTMMNEQNKERNNQDETKTDRRPKYKNNKFNMLLDLIQ